MNCCVGFIQIIGSAELMQKDALMMQVSGEQKDDGKNSSPECSTNYYMVIFTLLPVYQYQFHIAL